LNIIAEFPKNFFRKEDYETILNELSTIVKNNSFGDEETDRDTDLKKTNLNKILAIFIYEIGRQLRKEFYKEFVFFVVMYRKALNEIGWRKKAESTNVSPTEMRSEYCATNNGEYAPDISNDFITDKWPEYINMAQAHTSKFKFLGSDVELIKNTVFLTQHFCNWLNTRRYTNSRLAINEDSAI
jgi:hypothetical protein